MTSILKHGLTVVHSKIDFHDFDFHVELYKDGIYIGRGIHIKRGGHFRSYEFEVDISTEKVEYIFTYEQYEDNQINRSLCKYKETGDYVYRNVRFIQRDDGWE